MEEYEPYYLEISIEQIMASFLASILFFAFISFLKILIKGEL